MRLRILLLALVLMSIPVIAQYETVQGISAESVEYDSYKNCVDSCGSCEANCKNQLLENAASTKQDESFCMQIADEMRKNFCLDNVYRSKATLQNDPSFCDKLSVADEQERCRLSVQISKAVESSDVSACDELSEDIVSDCKNSFYQSMAFQTQDASYCDKLDANLQANCLNAIAQTEAVGQTEEATSGMQIDYAKYGVYGGIGVGAIVVIILIVFLIKKIVKPKKPKEAPLVVQGSTQGNVQQKPQEPNPVQPQTDIDKSQKAT